MDTDILLSTYNGEKYLKEQINSIIAQDYTNWRLLIRDDGSKDNTLDIIKDYCNQYPNKIKLIQDNKGNIGCLKSFEVLMYASDAKYLLFCDQDDIWLPNKVGETVSAIKQAEMDGSMPIVTHCDLKVVDSNLKVIDNSFLHYIKTNVSFYDKEPRFFSVGNYIPGCTMGLNYSAKLISLPFGKFAQVHDWWILLRVSCNGGKIIHINESLILYRQHQNNVRGVKKTTLNLSYYIQKLAEISNTIKESKKNYLQAKEAININLITYIKLRINLFWKFRYRISMK